MLSALIFVLKTDLEVLEISKQEHQINEEIRDREVLVIDDQGTKLGVLSAKEAQKIAYDKNLDLVKIAPQATPPVCRIMDYGKFCFEQAKREKEARKNQKVVEIKEIIPTWVRSCWLVSVKHAATLLSWISRQRWRAAAS